MWIPRRILIAAGTAGFIAAVLSGCHGAATISSPAPSTPPTHLATGAVVPSPAPSTLPGIRPQAAFEGRLALTESGCWAVAGRGGDDPEPILFPAGTTIDADASGGTVPGTGGLTLGESIELGGASIPASQLSGATIPRACTSDEFAAPDFG